jgi:hypothetical protein
MPVPATVRGPWQARQFSRRWLCPEHAGEIEWEALLVVSELVKDSLVRRAAPIRLSLDCWGSAVVISVEDHAPPAPLDEEGRQVALFLLETLTADWGVEPMGTGRRIWAMVRTAPQADLESVHWHCDQRPGSALTS